MKKFVTIAGITAKSIARSFAELPITGKIQLGVQVSSSAFNWTRAIIKPSKRNLTTALTADAIYTLVDLVDPNDTVGVFLNGVRKHSDKLIKEHFDTKQVEVEGNGKTMTIREFSEEEMEAVSERILKGKSKLMATSMSSDDIEETNRIARLAAQFSDKQTPVGNA